jgi:hypothetical protein
MGVWMVPWGVWIVPARAQLEGHSASMLNENVDMHSSEQQHEYIGQLSHMRQAEMGYQRGNKEIPIQIYSHMCRMHIKIPLKCTQINNLTKKLLQTTYE